MDSSTKHVIVFSHGFGVERDARGMFSDISAAFPESESILFDYNIPNRAENTLTVRPIAEQKDILLTKIARAKEKFPGATIDIIAHSLGSVVAALASPAGIRKAILLAPPLELASSSLQRFADRPGSVIDLDGLSRLARRDGSFTLVPAAFWWERATIDPVILFNALASKTDLTIIFANQDNVVSDERKYLLGSNIRTQSIDGDHDFRFEHRAGLLATLKTLLS